MAQERSEAIVMRGVDFSESSRIVTFLTPSRGKVACIASGIGRPKSPFAGVLDTFNRLEMVYYWKDGRGVQRLAEATVLDDFRPIKSDLEKSVYATLPLEFVYKVAQENEPSQKLFRTLVEGLKDFEQWDGPPRTHASWQMLRLLGVAGFEPDLQNADTLDERDRARTSPADIGALRRLAGAGPGNVPREDMPGAFDTLRRYTLRHIESEFRSLRVIDQMFGNRNRNE
ncbi:MAG: DNA repair protein RecO [Candidatus Hydrogenedentes bacterium]|nr:DNA repair protein RecO [Candidatus Hydrogenedentota bacterium]